MKKFWFLFFIVPLFSCEKDLHALFYSVENKTPVEIKVSPTKRRSQELVIKAGEYFERKILDMRGRVSFDGKGGGFDYDGDPVTITFDGKYAVTHYNESLPHEGKYLNKSSKRCIYNHESYAIKKFGRSSFIPEMAQYVFTEADYFFAKE